MALNSTQSCVNFAPETLKGGLANDVSVMISIAYIILQHVTSDSNVHVDIEVDGVVVV